MKLSSLFFLFFLCLSTLTGCYPVTLSDNVDLTFDFSLTPSDRLHLPYVTGSTVTITASGDDDEEPTWTLESSDPSIFHIEEQQGGRATCTARREGTVTMFVLNAQGEEIHDATITVVAPDRVELLAHGPLIVGIDDRVENTGVDVLTGGTASLLVRYFRGGERLFGNGALSVGASSDDIDAGPETTFIFENREWLQLTPLEPGLHEVEMFAGNVPIGTLEVRAREADDVASIELIEDERIAESDRDEDDAMVALGMARLDDGTPMYGVEFTWDLDGDGVPGTGDLFSYDFDPTAESVLGVAFDGLRAETTVRTNKGRVGSSNHLGCSAGGRDRSLGALTLGLLIALVMGTRRRHGKTASS